MAEGINRVTLLGNLGADPELRHTNNGGAVLKLRLATSETYFDQNKVKQERTEWHSVILWGKRAEALATMLGKGSRVLVEGRNQTSSWDDKEGHKRYKTEVVATNLIMCDAKRASPQRSEADDGYDTPAPPNAPAAGIPDDDIPF